MSSDNMGDFHGVIVDNISEMVSWESIGFYEHLIINLIMGYFDLTMDNILETSLTFRHLKKDNNNNK